MFATLFTVALFVLPLIQGVFADFNMANPTVTQCEDAPIKWDETTPPYNVIVVPAADTCGDALFDLGDHNLNHMTWPKVPLLAGTQVVFSVEDAKGNEAWSGTITVGPNTNASCLPPNLQTSAAANAALNPAGSTVVAPPLSSSSAVAVGAANAGLGSPSGAPSLRQISGPTLAISIIVGAVALFL